MKICPVCNDSFADELNFCDIDGTRLARDGSAPERNKWWSLLGAGLLVGALVISAASIIFLPKARPSVPIGSSETQSVPAAPRTPAPGADSVSSVAAAVTSEPESAPPDSIAPEVKKRDKGLANSNTGGSSLNPKAAALASEDNGKKSSSADSDTAPAPPSNAEPPPVKSVSDTQPAETKKSQPASESKRDIQPAASRVSDKDSNDKKKNDDKNKKKSGGFLRVFKKIFGKD